MNNLMNTLKNLRDDEVIRPIDVELCRFLSEHHPGISKDVLLAAVLVSHLYRQGHVCLPLEEYAGQSLFEKAHDEIPLRAPDLRSWRQVLQESPAVGSPGDYRPLILDDADRLYMHKLWHYEHSLAQELIRKSNQQVESIDNQLLKEGLERLFEHSTEQPDWQKVAAATSVRNKLSIISGGPGTGKTSTVVRILALILEQHQQSEESKDIALAAPTGKAAARLKDSIIEARDGLNITNNIRALIPENAQTIHQLLGARRHSAQFKHNAENPIQYNLVVVDEASMVDQALMSKLMEALLDDAQLILLGDKDQLASVEAGSVLGDICGTTQNYYSTATASWMSVLGSNIPNDNIIEQDQPLDDNITLLKKSYRFDAKSGIGKLSKAINAGKGEEALSILQNDQFNDVDWIEVATPNELEKELRTIIPDYFKGIIDSEAPLKALEVFNRFRLLSPHRKGPWGVTYFNQIIEKILNQQGLIPKYAQWYAGKPVIVTANHYSMGLFNGDTGVCLPDKNGELKIYFSDEEQLREFAPSRLPDYNIAFALTVHKSQGSEFDEVMFVLPGTTSKVMSRELIYTALTRARTGIKVVGEKMVFMKGLEHKIRRSSGLRDHLWK